MARKAASAQRTRAGRAGTDGKRNGVGYRPRVIVKFHDYVEIPYEDKAEAHIERLGVGPYDELSDRFGKLTLRRLYTAVEPEKLQRLVDQARERDRRYDPPNLLTYFVVDCPPGAEPEEIVEALTKWPTVEKAYFDPPGQEPTVNALDDPRSVNQGYLDPAPSGIDAEYAWTFPGGDGAGQDVIDMERGWTFAHEDLAGHSATLLHGMIRDLSRAHGTSVFGEFSSIDNAIGCVGIAPNVASLRAVSYWGSTIPDAILAAIANLGFGGALLLEAQISFMVGTTAWNLMPVEALDANYDTIRLATALGITVVEAAGNGGNDLDTFVDGTGTAILNRTMTGFRDSGAIMVGAGSSVAPHTRLAFSNFGSRIDCYGWGENVDTTSSDAAGAVNLYTATFNGTSSASPIVTGAALAVQGVAQATVGFRFSPRQLRGMLSDPATGTPSSNPAVDRIGVLPNLKNVIDSVLNVAADVYIRDFVGDTGDPHSGAISASPDVIVRPTAVTNPQTAFGAGSGTENDDALGYEVEAGQDNFIYVRVRNRGGSVATNVVADVYWSPVASLVTPNLWTFVGSVTLANVPTGNVLTVSDAVTWASADIPATGHYCFVCLIGNATDPPPGPAEFLNWDNFYRFIRENNNVSWRNFNVVDNEPSAGDPSGFVPLEFLAVGAPDRPLRMRLEVVAALPAGAKALLEVPLHMLDALEERPEAIKIEKRRGMAHLPVNPHGRFDLGEVLFPAEAHARLRLMVRIPEKERKNEYDVFVRQLYQREEVGRVTWRLARTSKSRRRPSKKPAQAD
jgi:Subtilase family